jgi:hypothetical protein
MNLSPEQTKRAIELLEIIVRPGDHDFFKEIEEAKRLFGYDVQSKKPKRRRLSFYGIRIPKP